MKKTTLIFLSFSALFFAGCQTKTQKEEQKETVVEITLSETSVQMPLMTWDEKQQESVPTTHLFTLTPANGIYTVDASKEDIVSITLSHDSVLLTAKNIGKTLLTITETTSQATATYSVEVVSELATLVFPEASVVYQYNEYLQSEYERVDTAFSFSNEQGEEIPLSVYVVDAEVQLFSEGFYIDDNGLLSGADLGYILAFPATAYYAPSTLNADKGYAREITYNYGVWSTEGKTNYHKLTGGKVENEQTALAHVAQAIEYSNQNQWPAYGEEMSNAAQIAFQGGVIRKYVRSDDGYLPYTMPVAIVPAAAFSLTKGTNTNSDLMFNIEEAEMYISPLAGYYGLGVQLGYNEQTHTYYLASDHFEFSDRIHYRYKAN